MTQLHGIKIMWSECQSFFPEKVMWHSFLVSSFQRGLSSRSSGGIYTVGNVKFKVLVLFQHKTVLVNI